MLRFVVGGLSLTTRRLEAFLMIGSVCRGGVGQYRPKAIDCPEKKGGRDEKAEDAGRCVASGRFRAYHGPLSRLLSIVLNGRLAVRAHDPHLWRWTLV